jgi:hypothetical protein
MWKMIDLIKAHKDLTILLISTSVAVVILGYLTFVKESDASDCHEQISEQVERLTQILDKEFTVDEKALQVAKKNSEEVTREYNQLMKELSVYSIPVIKMTATQFKAKLQDELIVINSKLEAAGIEVVKTKMPSLSVRDLIEKKESAYVESDFIQGSHKIIIIDTLADALVKAGVSKLEYLSWHNDESEKTDSFISALDFELTFSGSQQSVEQLVSDLSSNKRILFFVKSIECQNLTNFVKPQVLSGKEVDLASKESREIKVDNQLSCKLYVKVLQFPVSESK